MGQKKLSVVFLMWVPYGIQYLKRFISSYQQFSAGVEHDLVIIYNGFKREEDLHSYNSYLDDERIIRSSLHMERGQDIAAYIMAAQNLSTEYILFLNTYSEILANDWAKYYLDAIQKPDVGILAATGSWQSRTSYGIERLKWIFSRKSKIIENIPYYSDKTLKMAGLTITIPARLTLFGAFLKSMKDLSDFPLYPNSHIRTNAFIISRKLWLSLKFNSLATKRDAHLIESGTESITRQIKAMDKKVLVINRFGEVFEPKNWNNSRTLWAFNQENLLISDNFTQLYSKEDDVQKAALSKSIWGTLPEPGTATPDS